MAESNPITEAEASFRPRSQELQHVLTKGDGPQDSPDPEPDVSIPGQENLPSRKGPQPESARAEQPASVRTEARMNRGWFTKPSEATASYQIGSSKDWNNFDEARSSTDLAVKGGENGKSSASGGGNRASSEAVGASIDRSGHNGRVLEGVFHGGTVKAEVDKPDTRPAPKAPGHPGKPNIEGRIGEVPGTVNAAGNLQAGVEVQIRPVDARSTVRPLGRAGTGPSARRAPARGR